MIKNLSVKKIDFFSKISVDGLGDAMDKAGIEFNAIDVVNWEKYAYEGASIKFRIAHNNSAIFLQYIVKEPYIKAKYKVDKGSEPYKDSCVEFFIIPDNKNYYNLEQNCIAKGTFDGGSERTNRTRFGEDVMNQIIRKSSIPDELFKNRDIWSVKDILDSNNPEILKFIPKDLIRDGLFEWKIDIILPINLFSIVPIDSLSGKEMRANFYNCGDDMPIEHYLSWNPIEVEKPNFHTPDNFGNLIFE